MAVFGNIPGSNPQPWHELRVELFGTFHVRASDAEAAWLKLTLYCGEAGLGFDPSAQLEGLLNSDAPLDDATARLNELHGHHPAGIVVREYYQYNPTDSKRWPTHAGWLLGTTGSAEVVSLAEVAETRGKQFPNVA